MRVEGVFKFMGVVSRPGFNDPTKVNYMIGLAEGMDSFRPFIERDIYEQCVNLTPYSDVRVVLNYNPIADKASYCMRLVSIEPVSPSASGGKG